MDKKLILSVIEEYNKYHSPEATAKLKEIGKSFLIIKFFGPFCRSCGVSEWFEDLRIELGNVKIETSIDEIKEVGDESFVVKFTLEK